MQKILEGLKLLGLIDADLFEWFESDSSTKRVLGEGQASVDYGGNFYKVWETINNPIGTIIQLQSLRDNKITNEGQHISGETSAK